MLSYVYPDTYVVLIAIVFTISIGIDTCFISYKYTNHDKKNLLLNTIMSIKQYKGGNIKDINIKNQTYYFFNDMINIKDLDPNLMKIDNKSYKNTDIYYIGYIAVKDSDFVKINSVNPLYLIISEVDGYIKEKMEVNI